MNALSRTHQKGVTLIELLVALSVLAILIAFAAPEFQNTSAKSSMKSATEQVALALRTAKNAARINNTTVTVTLTTDSTNNSISFEFPNNTSIADSGQSLPAVILPPEVSISSATPVFTFNPLGMVSTTGSISLESSINDAFWSRVEINTLMGHVKVTAQYDDHTEEEETS